MTWAPGDGNKFHANGPFGLAAARSLIEGLTPDQKFGANLTLGTAKETIWTHSSLYAYLAAATVLQVSSGNAADTAAGTGMRTVRLWGLDTDWNPITADVELLGNTQVPTTGKEFLRIYRAKGLTYGSGGTNAGIIYAGTGSETTGVPQTTVDLVIAAGEGQTLMCVRAVPLGYTMYVEKIHFSVGEGKTVHAQLAQRDFGSGFAVKWQETIFETAIERDDLWFGPYDEKSDVELRGTGADAATPISAGFKYHLIKN